MRTFEEFVKERMPHEYGGTDYFKYKEYVQELEQRLAEKEDHDSAKRLSKKVAELDPQLKEAEAVIAAYENQDNWRLRHSAFDEEIWQGDGGKRARVYLEKHKRVEG